MIETPLMLAVGAEVHLIRGELRAQGEVVWFSGKRCGLKFVSEISVSDWLAPPSNVAQQRVDQVVALVKAGHAPGVGGLPSPDPASRRSQDQLVEDLGAVRRLMQDLEDDLASSPDTLGRHGRKLQNLDIAMQMLSAIAKELKPEAGNQHPSMAKLEDLRVVCEQALKSE